MFKRVASIFLLSCASSLAQQPASTPSVVYVAHDAAAVKDYRTNAARVRAMVDALLLALTHQPDIGHAWNAVVGSADRIGIKISATGGELFTTHRDLVNAIADGLVAAGHSRSSIVVWDRTLDGALGAGYRPGAEGYQLRSITPRDGYDRKAIFSGPLLGKLIWGDLDYRTDKGRMPPLSDTENTSSDSHFARIVSSEVTKIINVPVMSDSATNGIAGCLYNVTIPNLDNWRRFAQATGFAASGIPEIYSEPLIANKVVLHIMDGLVAQYAGGPESQPNFAVHFGTLYASTDPVAIDTLALRQLEEWRQNAHLPPIGRLATHVKVANEMGLGNADPARIIVKKIGP